VGYVYELWRLDNSLISVAYACLYVCDWLLLLHSRKYALMRLWVAVGRGMKEIGYHLMGRKA
jgi:hypothetical protein